MEIQCIKQHFVGYLPPHEKTLPLAFSERGHPRREPRS